MESCYCGSGKTFEKCCMKYLLKEDIVNTPSELIQSRYSGFCEKNLDYILFTNSDNVRRELNQKTIESWIEAVHFNKLEIVSVENDEFDSSHALVEFKVHFQVGYAEHIHYEIAHIIRHKGRWTYDGMISMKKRAEMGFKISLDDLCLCGSGKLFRECCAKSCK
ncbi:MAG: YchJ family metal-binding protein [Fusobacteria bacterium]|nr:YchJ family metal-binding protein [Fusobacteriota bacterium]